MCGIYGALELRSDRQVSRDVLSRMGGVIFHRGPDDQGEFYGGQAAIGMRRLSIIDLSGGHQPISNEDGTIWVVCNGEIYNFQDLRKELREHGHQFKTGSDTEVIVHAYEQYGLDFVKRFRGMFAFAVWDSMNRRLIVGRDRLGKKPLYMLRNSERILFSSELKSILQIPGVSRELEPAAISDYLSLGYVPAPLTPIRGIEKLLPGHLLIAENGSSRVQEYWDVQFGNEEHRSEEEWIELVREKLLESVRIRMISDVPLGAFLSGGIDSSTVVAAMSMYSDRPVKTYSIGFDRSDKYYDELPYARMIVDKFSTSHHEIIVRPNVADLLPRLMWHLDEPMADSAFITTYLVSKLARESVTVILSGVGGDELFGGYRRYLGDTLAVHYRRMPGFARSMLKGLMRRLPQGRHSALENNVRYGNAFLSTAELEPRARYKSYVEVLSGEMKQQLLADSRSPQVFDQFFDKASEWHPCHQLLYVDMKTSLPDDLLALTDKMTMAASIECRAPFMDHELVELSARIPWELKVKGFTMKYLLKKAVEPILPKEIIHRKKRGFGAPVGAWFKQDLSPLVREMLDEASLRKRGIFNPEGVKRIIADHESHRADHSDGLLALLAFETWCQLFVDGADRQFHPPVHATATSNG